MPILLAYPYTSPHRQEIALSNPQLGDSRQINIKTQLKQNMDGQIYTHKKTPSNSKFLLIFKTLNEVEAAYLAAFYSNWMGNVIEYVDPDSVSWQVMMAMDSLVITTQKDGCSYDAILELVTV